MLFPMFHDASWAWQGGVKWGLQQDSDFPLAALYLALHLSVKVVSAHWETHWEGTFCAFLGNRRAQNHTKRRAGRAGHNHRASIQAWGVGPCRDQPLMASLKRTASAILTATLRCLLAGSAGHFLGLSLSSGKDGIDNE